MSLPMHLAALRDEAMQTSCEAWAIRCRWKLAKGIDREGPCPLCGGTDRFAIHTGKNTFNCRRCGLSGSGVIDLVMKTQNVDFTRACEIVTGRSADAPIDPERARRLAAEADADREKREREAAEYRERARRAGRVIWEDATPRPWQVGQPVFDYLAVRGIDLAKVHAQAPEALHRVIRQAIALPWWEQQGRTSVTLHTGPAMVAAIQYPDGRFSGAHITWIDLDQPKGKLVLPPDDNGKDRKAKKMRGTHMGCAIRLYTPPHPRRLVMGEGIESTLSVLCHAFEPDTAYWAGASLGNMAGKAARSADNKQIHDQPDTESECFLPPDWCEELVFLTDGDSPESRITEKLTRGLRRAMRLRPGLKAKRVPAPSADADTNDLAMQMRDAISMGVGA